MLWPAKIDLDAWSRKLTRRGDARIIISDSVQRRSEQSLQPPPTRNRKKINKFRSPQKITPSAAAAEGVALAAFPETLPRC
jgi:hypothetical protein